MIEIYSKINGELLHVIHERKDFLSGRKDLIPSNQFIQIACLKVNSGKKYLPHKHVWKTAPEAYPVIAQEAWSIIQGSVKFYFYDIDDTLLGEEVLREGDCSVTLKGGHSYEILEDNTLVYEFKTGPYQGRELDKEDIAHE